MYYLAIEYFLFISAGSYTTLSFAFTSKGSNPPPRCSKIAPRDFPITAQYPVIKSVRFNSPLLTSSQLHLRLQLQLHLQPMAPRVSSLAYALPFQRFDENPSHRPPSHRLHLLLLVVLLLLRLRQHLANQGNTLLATDVDMSVMMTTEVISGSISQRISDAKGMRIGKCTGERRS